MRVTERLHGEAVTPSTGRVLIARGVGSVTLTLRHWELQQTATLTLDEARELVSQLQAAVDRKDAELGPRITVTVPEGAVGVNVYRRDNAPRADDDDFTDLI
jgi:hypothetical protein